MLNESEIYRVAKILTDGTYGSFMCSIGCALILADSDNKKRLVEAFRDKLETIHANAVKSESLNTL